MTWNWTYLIQTCKYKHSLVDLLEIIIKLIGCSTVNCLWFFWGKLYNVLQLALVSPTHAFIIQWHDINWLISYSQHWCQRTAETGASWGPQTAAVCTRRTGSRREHRTCSVVIARLSWQWEGTHTCFEQMSIIFVVLVLRLRILICVWSEAPTAFVTLSVAMHEINV